MTTPDPRDRLQEALRERYTRERELGRGGMAVVYLAHDLRHDRPVALKVLLPSLARSLGGGRFLREIRTAARLQHPHILSVHDSGEADGQLWFAMPYVEGETLRQRLQREGQLSVPDALRLTREVADGLDFAHRHGVDGYALVADFGISRALAAEEAGEGLLYAGLGDTVETFAWLRRALEGRDPFLIYNYVSDPVMAPFRRDPRGQAILRGMGLAER
jgi:serine/threonine-protein kinase